jgi:endonuclease-3
MIRAMGKAVGKSLPSVSRIARKRRDPFRILMSTVLSLRTKDEVTDEASKRLFAIADTPRDLSKIPVRTIEKAIYPVGFYKTKARSIKRIAAELENDHAGIVPDSIDELLKFKGVGRKTANLVVTLGYGKDGICVDTHVHRVSNRLGLVKTKTPEKTEFALMDVLPRKHWIGYNELLVSFGQKVCKPISPHCSICPLQKKCPQIGVGRHR